MDWGNVLTETYLKKAYIQEEKSACQIASVVGCHHSVVQRYLKKHSIKMRSRSEANILSKRKWRKILTREFLEREYLQKKRSTTQIGESVGCHSATVSHYLAKYGIKARENGEAVSIREQNGKGFDLNAIRSYIDGLLLSDGNICTSSKFSGMYRQICKHKEWLDAISKKFHEHGIKNTVSKTIINGRRYYRLFTLSYPEFKTLHSLWYLNKIKVIPRDIELTPGCLANWYLGDGYLLPCGAIRIGKVGFSQEDSEFLIKKLNQELSIDSRKHKPRSIYIPQRDALVFLKYIEDFKIPCYSYKWAHKLDLEEERGRLQGKV